MTGYHVPHKPPLVPVSGNNNPIRTGWPVRGNVDWKPAGRQALWLLGGGSSLVSAGPDTTSITTASALRFYAWPHVQNTDMLWMVGLSCGDAQGANGSITDLADNELARWQIRQDSLTYIGMPKVFAIAQQHVATPANGEIGIKIVNDTYMSDVYVTGVTCTEVPRAFLEPGDVNPADTDSLASKMPICDTGTSAGLRQLARAANEAITDSRRACLCSIHLITAWTTASGTFATPFTYPDDGDNPVVIPVLARCRYSGEGAAGRTVAWAALVTGTGEVKVTAASGDTDTQTFTGATDDWVTGTIDIDAESMTDLGAADGGLQSATRDTLTVELRATSGTIEFNGFCAGETD